MAGYWIKFETSTSDKPEVWFIADRLGIDPDAVVGKLLRIWAWFDDHTEKGNAPSVTKALLDRRVGVTGFCDAMIEAGWMLEEDGFVLLPHFDRHNGKTAKSRVLTAKRVASHKKSNADGNAKGNAASVTSALPRREEKRRDNIELSKDSSCVEHGSAPACGSQDSGFVFAMQSGAWHLPERKLAEYTSTYKLDVRREILKAAQWLRDNKERRPRTGTGVQKFLTRWLNRADNGTSPSARLSGKITNDDTLKQEMARARLIRQERMKSG